MKIIRQNWECFGNGTVVCQEAIEDCSACDGMVKISDLTNSYNLTIATGRGEIEEKNSLVKLMCSLSRWMFNSIREEEMQTWSYSTGGNKRKHPESM